MSYDDKVRNEVQIEIGVHRQGAYSWQANDALNAIPPLTLKTEDGRFVKVEAFAGWDMSPQGEGPVQTYYRILPEPQP